MKKIVMTAVLYTVVTAVLLGVIYPMIVTGIGQVFFRNRANGQMIVADGHVMGSKIIGQPFTGATYFHSRPSAAGTGYDAGASSGSNLGPTNKLLVDRVAASVAAEGAKGDVPVDLVTASGSGLDPDISPAAALYQVERVAAARRLDPTMVRDLVVKHVTDRQFGLLGEPRVNVLLLNRDLDAVTK